MKNLNENVEVESTTEATSTVLCAKIPEIIETDYVPEITQKEVRRIIERRDVI